MILDDQTLSALAAAAFVLAILGITFSAFALRRRLPAVPPLEDRTLRKVLEDQANALRELEAAARALHGADRKQQGLIDAALRKVALVRYDAFEDVGGRLSFSCAFLDDHGDGVVVTSINGRQDTRVYAKPVQAGKSSYSLSTEEEEAIARAIGTA